MLDSSTHLKGSKMYLKCNGRDDCVGFCVPHYVGYLLMSGIIEISLLCFQQAWNWYVTCIRLPKNYREMIRLGVGTVALKGLGKNFFSKSYSVPLINPGMVNPAFTLLSVRCISFTHLSHTQHRNTNLLNNKVNFQDSRRLLNVIGIPIRQVKPFRGPMILTRGLSIRSGIRNVRNIVYEQYDGKAGRNLRYKIFVVIFIILVLNLLFNAMMFVLTNMYLDDIQKVPLEFGFWAATEYKQGIVHESLMSDDVAANKHYLETLKMIYEKYCKDIDEIQEPFEMILSTDTLEGLANSRRFTLVSSYFDLLMRIGLTSRDPEISCVFITKALNLIEDFQVNYTKEFGKYQLKSFCLRFLADYLQMHNHSDPKTYGRIETLYLEAIKLIRINEEKNYHNDEKLMILNIDDNYRKHLNFDISVIEEGVTVSNLMIYSILDLTTFYIGTHNNDYIKRSLPILLSLLRSIEFEYHILEHMDNPKYKHKLQELPDISNDRARGLQYEVIPLVKSNLSEVLWHFGDKEKAVELAREAAFVSMTNSKDNANSAKIAKTTFKNLSSMYKQMGDSEGTKLCLDKYEEIVIPLHAFIDKKSKLGKNPVRDAVLERYFGPYGKMLFP